METQLFPTLLYTWLGLAVAVFVVLFVISAPYGRHARAGWGPQINRTVGWVDAEVANLEAVEETIRRWSPRFFELLTSTSPAENARLAQAGTLVLEVQGRVVRIVDGS